jgi:hypothetical protein
MDDLDICLKAFISNKFDFSLCRIIKILQGWGKEEKTLKNQVQRRQLKIKDVGPVFP